MKKLIKNCKYDLKYNYYITDDGKVWSEKTNRFLSTHLDKDGYVKVRLVSFDGRHTYSVHRLLLENFKPIDNMDKLQVNHIDGDKTNNHLSNLEWTTCKENIYHAIKNDLRAKINGAAKITPEQAIEIYRRANNGERNVDLAKEFGLTADHIGRIKSKKLWKQYLS